MPHMKALTAQVFAGIRILTGDEFDATDAEAKLLVALQRAQIVKKPAGRPRKDDKTIDITDLDSATPDPFPSPVSSPRQRRSYTRRDMTAQDA